MNEVITEVTNNVIHHYPSYTLKVLRKWKSLDPSHPNRNKFTLEQARCRLNESFGKISSINDSDSYLKELTENFCD
jgi:hypothetical protein